MKIVVIGGGPGGLYFGDPDEARTTRATRSSCTNATGSTTPSASAWSFSDATMAHLEAADPDTYRAITDHFVHWDDIDIHYGGRLIRSTGHGFAGMSRQTLLTVLQEQAAALGVEVVAETEINDLDAFADADLILGADGVNSTVRELLADRFRPRFDWRPNRFVWLGTTKPFPAFTFYFREDEHGLWRVHAYQYEPGHSTFIVECREDTWRSAGMDEASEEETKAFCEALFAEELEGHPLILNRSLWRSFPTIRCDNWSASNIVLIGDAVHTAHFSVGSGTRLAMMDAIELRKALVAAGRGGAGPPVDRRGRGCPGGL